jgi:flagellar hook assembly protein FlgD
MAAVEIYNVMGQRIRLLDKANYTAGIHEVTWDGRDDSGSMMGSGIYLFRVLVFGNNQNTSLFQQTRKMLFIK